VPGLDRCARSRYLLTCHRRSLPGTAESADAIPG
jgi:hypothetical protein